ncbi:hypothetical protein GSI_08925 [Ganoderma sinense ZZ0214-1]|uniref:HAT C-terminal dimerisation domain-containing protein n=1 Tax=Ganoderma sinense ZZ0214-1 TaxID=1077348 RepID=A0A2G8S516_9APHY|nr:hypothetical protein GSI_08925 [Ganoderma sinense ZZ0214-1]
MASGKSSAAKAKKPGSTSKPTGGKKKPAKTEKTAGQRCPRRTQKKRKAVVLSDSESEADEDDEPLEDKPPPKKKQKATSRHTKNKLERDGLEIVEDGPGSADDEEDVQDEGRGEEDAPKDDVDSEKELERARGRWRSPIYAFFEEDVVVDYKDDRKSHLFTCAAKGCGIRVRRFLDTKDAASSGNLFKHARGCWGDEAVDRAIKFGDANVVREKLVKPKKESKSITEFFNQKAIMDRSESLVLTQSGVLHRVWAVRWVAEDLHPFKMVADRGFLMIAKSGRPGYYVPSPTMVSRDVKVVFIATRKRLAKMLQGYSGKLSFASDAWTSPNHRSFIAVTVHLEVKGRPLRMLLDLVELAKSHTGVNLAVAFRDVLHEFGIESKVLSITLDNASNNNKMVDHLARILAAFEGEYHHTRCFAHVTQLVARGFVGQFEVKGVKGEDVDGLVDDDVHALLKLAENMDEEEREAKRIREREHGGDKELEEGWDDSVEEDDEEWVSEVASLTDEEREEYEKQIRPVKMALVKLRKFSFKIVNSSTKLLPAWRTVTADLKLPNRLLPRDVRTRWNSTYDMLVESLIFRPAIDKMSDPEEEYGLGAYRLKKKEWTLLEQLADVLKVFKHATEFFSRETPSLATVIPAMDYIDTTLTNQARDETLDKAIQTAVGMAKKILSKYYKLTDLSATYRIAMILHPEYKLRYFEEAGWSRGWIQNAREMLEEQYDFQYKPEEGDEDSQQSDEDIKAIPEGANIFDHLPSVKSTRKLASAAASEIERYLSTGTVKVNNPLKWWTDNAALYPNLSHMALDYLSIPATAVDVERVFSKGRLCLSHIRNRLSAQTTRALLCVGEWSRLDLVHMDDIKAAAALPDLPEDEEESEDSVQEGWDRIHELLASK